MSRLGEPSVRGLPTRKSLGWDALFLPTVQATILEHGIDDRPLRGTTDDVLVNEGPEPSVQLNGRCDAVRLRRVRQAADERAVRSDKLDYLAANEAHVLLQRRNEVPSAPLVVHLPVETLAPALVLRGHHELLDPDVGHAPVAAQPLDGQDDLRELVPALVAPLHLAEVVGPRQDDGASPHNGQPDVVGVHVDGQRRVGVVLERALLRQQGEVEDDIQVRGGQFVRHAAGALVQQGLKVCEHDHVAPVRPVAAEGHLPLAEPHGALKSCEVEGELAVSEAVGLAPLTCYGYELLASLVLLLRYPAAQPVVEVPLASEDGHGALLLGRLGGGEAELCSLSPPRCVEVVDVAQPLQHGEYVVLAHALKGAVVRVVEDVVELALEVGHVHVLDEPELYGYRLLHGR